MPEIAIWSKNGKGLEVILGYLRLNERITNRIARDLCFIGSENKMKGVLQRLVRKGLIELVPGTTRYSAAYRLVPLAGEP